MDRVGPGRWQGAGVPEPTGLLGRRGSPRHAPALSGGLSPQKRNQPYVRRWRPSRTSPVQTRETRLLWACACGCFSAAWLTVAAAHAHPGPADPREQHRPSGPDQRHGYSGHGSPRCPQEAWAQPTRATPTNQGPVLASSVTVRSVDKSQSPGQSQWPRSPWPTSPDRIPGSACGQTVRLSISQVAAKRQSASKERVKFWRGSAQVEAPEAPGQPPRGGRARSRGCGQRSPKTQGPAHRWRRPPEPRLSPRMHTLLHGEGRHGTATRPGPASHTFEPPSGKGAASRLTDPWPPSPISSQPEGEAPAG